MNRESDDMALAEMNTERMMYELAIVQRIERAGLVEDARYVARSFGLIKEAA